MSVSHHDTLIVGQGLAGSALAWQLIAAGQRVCVIDDGHRSASSMVAAGLINPLAGMRFNRRPQVRDWLDAADAWYAALGRQFGEPFLHPLPMLRLLRSPDQQRFYARRRDDADSRDLLGDAFPAGHCPEPVQAPYGGFLQRRTGYVDIPRLLATLRTWLGARDALVTDAVDHGHVDIGHGEVGVAGHRARRLVFCDGARLRENRWFDWLPLAPVKGEIIDLDDGAWQPRHIVNGAHWLLPLRDGGLRFGATHDHARIDDVPTRSGRDGLLAAYHGLRGDVGAPRISAHRAGIRPGTADRYPLLGQHPDHAPLWVFNGFGARGSLSIPWYAARMADHLLLGDPLPVEADIARICKRDPHR